jgi:hypothetical protein
VTAVVVGVLLAALALAGIVAGIVRLDDWLHRDRG